MASAVFIAGAGRGVGRATARACAREGANVLFWPEHAADRPGGVE